MELHFKDFIFIRKADKISLVAGNGAVGAISWKFIEILSHLWELAVIHTFSKKVLDCWAGSHSTKLGGAVLSPIAGKTFLISLQPPLRDVSWQEELAGMKRRWFVCFFSLGKRVWLSGPTCFCDIWAASLALILAGYILIFYQEDAAVVRDSLFIESQLSIAPQAFRGLDFFISFPLYEEPFAHISFSFFFPFLKAEKCLRNVLAHSHRLVLPVMY